jgi:catechol 2,3-dioxygenase-like lactoylglutathione lyase family enzyme
MPKLAHVNIRSADLEQSLAFYRDVLGLTPGPAATRPESVDHVWMSDEDGYPCVHLQRASQPSPTPGGHRGVHHVALSCSGLQRWRDKLESIGLDYQEAEFRNAKLVQLNLRDPDGVRLELLFEDDR